MNSKLNIGIIGAGKIVESIHLPVLLNIPDVSVQWIYDKSNERVQLVSKMYGVKSIDAEQLDENLEAIDICLIAVPYGVRDGFIRKCAALKKCIYVEKPFATSVKEHQGYCDLFAVPDIAVGFQRRYYPFIADIRQIINERSFGNIKAIHVKQGYFQLKGGGGFASDAKLSGGGVIIESAIHTLDQVLQFTNAKRLEVKEVNSLSKNGIDYDTRFTTTVSSEENTFNVYGHISCLRNLDNGISIEFEKGSLTFQPAVNTVLYNDNNVYHLQQTATGSSCSTVNASFTLFWKDFIDAIKSRRPNQTNAEASLLTTNWIEQLYQGINNALA